MKYAELKAGMKLVAGHGFTCIKQGAVLDVREVGAGEFVVTCEHGVHHLDDQVYEGQLIGFDQVVSTIEQ